MIIPWSVGVAEFKMRITQSRHVFLHFTPFNPFNVQREFL